MTQQQFLTGGQMTHESKITLRTQRAEKIGQHGAAFVFQNAAHERGAEGKALHKEVQHAAAGAHGLVARAIVDARDARVTLEPAHIGQGSSVT